VIPIYREILKPKPKPIVVDGVISYSESCRARNVIRLKKEIVKEFSDLKDRNKAINYKLEYHRNKAKLNRRIKEITENGEGMPFLLFIYSEKETAEV
jgi:hypothetical protein